MQLETAYVGGELAKWRAFVFFVSAFPLIDQDTRVVVLGSPRPPPPLLKGSTQFLAVRIEQEAGPVSYHTETSLQALPLLAGLKSSLSPQI